MDSLGKNSGESEAHLRLKRLALVWAQAHGYSACGVEVTLPRCRYRADVAAFKSNRVGATCAIFECKQALVDLRRDNGCTSATRQRLESAHRRRETLERHLRVHYPALRIPDSLFLEFDSHNFAAIEHRGYKQVLRQVRALQNRLYDGTKFETLVRYCCANLFFIVVPDELYRDPEIPLHWGALIERNNTLVLARKPGWQDMTPRDQSDFLQRIAISGTRGLNRALGIPFDQIAATRAQSI